MSKTKAHKRRGTKETGQSTALAKRPRNPAGRHRKRPWAECGDILERIETVYQLHVSGHSVRAIAEQLELSRGTTHRAVKAGRQLALKGLERSLAELRADSVSRIAMLQRRALDAFDADPSPAWLVCAAGLEKLRVSLEGTAVDPRDTGRPLEEYEVVRLGKPETIVKSVGLRSHEAVIERDLSDVDTVEAARILAEATEPDAAE